MAGRKHLRAAAVSVAAIAVVWAVVALVARAEEEPSKLPPEFFPRAEPETLPKPDVKTVPPPKPQVVGDPNVEPAQYTRPVAQPPATQPGSVVPDPPHPVVRIQVRVPSDAAPGEDLKYIITVQNISTADAHSVTVRNPIPADVERVVNAEPRQDNAADSNPRAPLVWSLGTLKAGTSRTIELTLRPKEGVTELKNLAYVKFEHGQAVTTKLAKPTIKVTKAAPKQSVRDETYTVRIGVTNTGKVLAEGVRVVENVPASAEIESVTNGGKRIAQAQGQQWVWEIAKLQPGERKVIEYRVTPREAKDVFTLTSVSGTKLVADKPAEARTQVLVPGLEVKLTGPTGVVNAGESAKYEIVVRNTGTLPSTNLKVSGTIPSDCKPTMKTDGGQIARDSIVWQIQRLEPGDAQSFRFAIKANTTGRRVVVANATDARGQRAGQELATVFQGTAALSWETKFDPLTVAVGRQGTFTVKVKNSGGESARNVRVQVDVPDAVTVVQTTPNVRVTNGVVLFGTESIPGNGEATYTITFQGAKADQAWFRVRMAADALGDRPMQTEKMVEIIGNPR